MIKVKQITFNEALDYIRKKETVYVFDSDIVDKPKLENLANLKIGKILDNEKNYIFQVIEEVNDD